MTDAIISLLKTINNLILGIGGNTTPLTGLMEGFSPAMYQYSVSILQNVAMPVAMVILALFFTLELYKASMRIEGAGGGTHLGVEMIFRVMVKMTLCKMALDMTPTILNAIYNGTRELTLGIVNLVGGSGSVGSMDTAALEPALNALGFWGGIPVIIIVCIILLVTLLAVGFSNVIIVARFFELYVYLCISPIPIATLPNEEMSQIGKNFLKSFAAVCVQGTLIIIVLLFFPILLTDGFLHGGTTGDIYLYLLQVLGYSIVLILAIFTTGKWAKSICNAM